MNNLVFFRGISCLALFLTGLLSQAQNNGPTAFAERLGYESTQTKFDLLELYQANGISPISATHRFGEDISDTDVNLNAPLFIDSNREFAMYTSVIYNRRSNDQETWSIGLGTRWVLPAIKSVAGFRIHGDSTGTAFGNRISQLGLGAELFTTKGLDIIGNFYLPESDDKLAREFRQNERFVSQSLASSTRTTFDAPYAQGHAILQEQTDVTTVKQTTRTTDISRLFQQHEAGRKGGDLRAVFDIPFFERRNVFRGMIGAYHYDAPFNGADLSGVMAGLTFSPLDGFQVGAEYYDDEEVFGSNWVGTVGVSMPLDFETLLNPADWDNAIADALAGGGRSEIDPADYLASRLFSAPTRNNRVIVGVSDPVEDPSQRIVRTRTSTKTVGTSTAVSTKTILDNVVFVNNGGAVGNGIAAGAVGGIGTAENPSMTIQQGANNVQTQLGGAGTVYVQATATPYVETVYVGADRAGDGAGANGLNIPAQSVTSIHFTSSVKPIVACGSFHFGGVPGGTQRLNAVMPNASNGGQAALNGALVGGAIVQGGFDLRGENGLAFAQIEGFAIDTGINGAGSGGNIGPNENGVGISIHNVASTVINCNIIDNVDSHGILNYVDNGYTSTSSIYDNYVANYSSNFTNRHGIHVRTNNAGTTAEFLIRNNEINGTTTSGDDGILAQNTASGVMSNLEITNNYIHDVDRNGIYVISNNGGGNAAGIQNGRVDNNVIRATGVAGDMDMWGATQYGDGHGIYFRHDSVAGSTNFASISNNDIRDNFRPDPNGGGGHGIRIMENSVGGGSLNIADVDNNRIENTRTHALDIRENNGGGGAGTAADVSTTTIGSVDGNEILAYGDAPGNGWGVYGINVESFNTTTLNIGSINENRIHTSTAQPGRRAIQVQRREESTQTIGSIDNNLIGTAAGGGAISGDGILIHNRDDVTNPATTPLTINSISGNQIAGAERHGISVELDGGNNAWDSVTNIGAINNNVIDHSAFAANGGIRGINVSANRQNVGTINSIDGNRITFSRGQGIYAVANGNISGMNNVANNGGNLTINSVSNNTIEDNQAGDGSRLEAVNEGTLTLGNVDNNTVNRAANAGFEIAARNIGTTTVQSFDNNTITTVGSRALVGWSSNDATLTMNSITGNQVTDTQTHGFELRSNNNSTNNFFNINNNTITDINGGNGNNRDGIRINANNTSTTTAQGLEGNVIDISRNIAGNGANDGFEFWRNGTSTMTINPTGADNTVIGDPTPAPAGPNRLVNATGGVIQPPGISVNGNAGITATF